MRFSKYRPALSGLVVYRASLLVPGQGRVGHRLPGLKKAQREWCYHSRSRRDFVLLLLMAEFQERRCDAQGLMGALAISRNTLKAILREAEALHIIAPAPAPVRDIAICGQFTKNYMASYHREWGLIDKPTAEMLAVAFKDMAKIFAPLSAMRAQEKALQMSMISRAETVNANREHRLTQRNHIGPMDLSSWVVATSFNRDLLLLLMSAAIEKRLMNVTDIMKSLYVSRNAVKASLKIALESGFIEKSLHGFMAEQNALLGYLDWYGEVFSNYPDDVLSAFSVYYDALATRNTQ